MRRILPLFLSVAAVVLVQHRTPTASAANAVPRVKMTYFALDHGDAALLQPPGGKNILMGAGGPGDGPDLIRSLKRVGCGRIDALVVSAWSDRNVGGGIHLLEHLPMKQVLETPLIPRQAQTNPFLLRAMELGKAKQMEVYSPAPGETVTLFYTPPVEFRAVGPTGPMLVQFRDDLSCSLVTEVSFKNVSLLNLGETTVRHQKVIWDAVYPKPWGQVLTVGRSGGDGALQTSLLKPLKTKIAVIPVPRKSGPRPAASTLQALKKAGVRVYRTDVNGNVVVTTDGNEIKVTTER